MPECVCPPEPYLSIATSNLPPFLSTPADVAICTLGFVAPWAFFVFIVLLKTRVRWKLASEWPVALSMVPPNVGLWLQSSIAIVVALAVFAARAPSDVWGECALKGVCVYHDMFCEATHHASAIRHPANFWSNVPYALLAVGLLIHVAEERFERSSRRAYLLLDASFAVLLLLHSIASFAWHGTNCTDVHWVDIALMNNTCVPHEVALSPLDAR